MTCVPHVMRPEPQTQDTLLTTLCSAYSHDQTMVSLKINLDFHQEWNKNWNWLLFFVSLDTFYGGESISSDTPQSFSCPYCGKLGYTETALYDHVTTDHTDTPYEVVMIWINKYLQWGCSFTFHFFHFNLGLSNLCFTTWRRAQPSDRRFCCSPYHGTSW